MKIRKIIIGSLSLCIAISISLYILIKYDIITKIYSLASGKENEHRQGDIQHTNQTNNQNVPQQQQELAAKVLVDPLYNFDRLLTSFEGKDTPIEQQAALVEHRNKLYQAKKENKIPWNPKVIKIKEKSYYQSLDTSALFRECFETSLFASELSIYDDSRFGLLRLDIMHDGFAELFSRNDFSQGLANLYIQQAENLSKAQNLSEIINASSTLASLSELYKYSPTKDRIMKSQRTLFEANLYALAKYDEFLINYDPTKYDNCQIPCYYEPCMVVETTLVLYKQINPMGYNELIEELRAIKWPQDQNIEDVKKYLGIILSRIKFS